MISVRKCNYAMMQLLRIRRLLIYIEFYPRVCHDWSLGIRDSTTASAAMWEAKKEEVVGYPVNTYVSRTSVAYIFGLLIAMELALVGF